MTFTASQTATATAKVAPHFVATDWSLTAHRKPAELMPPSRTGKPVTATAWKPAVEIQETADYIYVQLQLPGLTRDEIEVQAFDRAIVVQGAHFSCYGPSRGCVLASEFGYGAFERNIQLPGAIAQDQIEAELCQGLLTLSLRKAKI
jgi:HSP20 family molecular chaperone IbpA